MDNHLLLHCEVTFSCFGVKNKTEPALKQNMKNIHLEKQIVCEYCSKRLSIKSTHDEHVLNVHARISGILNAHQRLTWVDMLKVIKTGNLLNVKNVEGDFKWMNYRLDTSWSTQERNHGCGQCGFRCQQSVDSTKHYKSPWHGYEESSRNIKPPFTCRNLYLLQKIVIFLSLKDFKVVIHKYFYFDLFYQMF